MAPGDVLLLAALCGLLLIGTRPKVEAPPKKVLTPVERYLAWTVSA